MEENMRDKFPENLVWRYFTPEEMSNARCNICQRRIRPSPSQMRSIERHLTLIHPEVIEEVREEIRGTWLIRYFVFDQVKIWRVRCIRCDQYYCIFKGIKNLEHHLGVYHSILRYSWEQQHPVAEGAHGEPAEAHPHNSYSVILCGTNSMMEENMRDKYPENLVWRYFTPEEMSNARCNICQRRIRPSPSQMRSIERHLTLIHPEVIEEVREEIRGTWLIRYFVFDQVKIWRVRCIRCDQYYGIFKGIKKLEYHLGVYHSILRYSWEQQHPVAEGAHGEPADAHPQLVDQDG